MLSLRQTLYAQLPDWTQPSHAVLRYVLHRRSRRHGWRLLGRSGGVMAIVGLVTISWLAYHVHSPLVVGDSCSSALLAVLYFPMLILQFVLLILALVRASDAVTTEQQRGTWELCRVTSHGAEKLVLTRWVAVFYQMRALFVALMVPRVLFAGIMLIDMASYRGHYLNLYMAGSPSPVPLSVSVIMLAALTTAALVQFPVLIGLNAAIGVLISAAFRKREIAGLARIVVFAGEIALFGLAFQAMRSALESDPRAYVTGHAAEPWADWMLIGTLGDQGLRLMDLRTFLQTWIDVDSGVLLGGALLILVIAQVLMTREALVIAARLAARPVSD
jgi:hypothetical protein